MKQSSTIDALNRLLQILNRSLPMYLHSARPWTAYGDPRDGRIVEVLQEIVDDQQRLVDRVATLIVDHSGKVDLGGFPLEFTGLHDLSIDYLLRRMVQLQKRDLRGIEQCVDQLRLAPLARATAEECLGAAKAHLESLEDLRKLPGDRSSSGGPQLTVTG